MAWLLLAGALTIGIQLAWAVFAAMRRRRNRPKAFVSYARTHRDLIRNIVGLLKVTNSSVFFDEDIAPGYKWEDVVLSALKDAPTFVVFWCRHAQKSEWIRKEFNEAIRLGKRIVPVLLDHTELPAQLEPFQRLEFRRLCEPFILECPAGGGIHKARPERQINYLRLSSLLADACRDKFPSTRNS